MTREQQVLLASSLASHTARMNRLQQHIVLEWHGEPLEMLLKRPAHNSFEKILVHWTTKCALEFVRETSSGLICIATVGASPHSSSNALEKVKRGDILYQVNDTVVTASNWHACIEDMRLRFELASEQTFVILPRPRPIRVVCAQGRMLADAGVDTQCDLVAINDTKLRYIRSTNLMNVLAEVEKPCVLHFHKRSNNTRSRGPSLVSSGVRPSTSTKKNLGLIQRRRSSAASLRRQLSAKADAQKRSTTPTKEELDKAEANKVSDSTTIRLDGQGHEAIDLLQYKDLT